jgi:hypothetical protein
LAVKKSYTVPCSARFRDAVNDLANQRGVNAADLARSILLAVPPETVDAAPDTGEPGAADRETVILKTGPAAGRPWRRKPRLQVRMAEGTTPLQIRRALSLALALAEGRTTLALALEPKRPAEPKPLVKIDPAVAEALARLEHSQAEIERLRAVVATLAFAPLPHGIRTRDEALHVLGFPPGMKPAPATVRTRFRMLATIHHPDSPYGSHDRMSQLNAAVDLLKRG